MKLIYLICSSLTSLMLLTGGQSAQAAESVVLKYNIFRGSVPVKDLRRLADTGETTLTLKAYLKLANQEPETLQSALSQKVKIDGVTLSKALNSFAGEIILDQMAEVIHTPSKKASRESLRGALVQSALDDDHLQMIEVLEHYPTQEVHVDGNRIREIYRQIQAITDKIPFLTP
ncbi:MAG: alpha/beta hydrolase [Microcystaceae cyanobacterium]